MSAAPRQRVHWVSPLPPAQTDIAHYTARILPDLARTVDLTLWTDAEAWDPALEAHCPVRRLDPHGALPRDLVGPGRGPGSDLLFINIGNSWVYHSGLMALARRLPSVIVLHDLAVQEMLYDCVRFAGVDPEIYARGMARWYGEEGERQARRVLAGELPAYKLVGAMPGFELALDRAIAVLSHTRIAFEAVAAREELPSYLLDLPFAASPAPDSFTRPAEGPLRLLQFGYIGPNRRVEEILEVLAALKREVDFRLEIMGKVWDPGRIDTRIAQLELSDRVSQRGFVPEADLDRALAEAHLVFNLRHPTVGEASGSQLRIWNAGAAAAVSDQGFYAGLPDETVFKIPPEGERAELTALIRRFAADRDIGCEVGRQGRRHFEAYHTPDRYARGIAEIAARAGADAIRAQLMRSANRLLARGAPQEILRQRLAHQIVGEGA